MNGYKVIEIEGKKVGLKFAFPAVKWFSEIALADKDGIYFVESGITDYGLAKLMQCAYRNNCLLKEEEPELKFGHFAGWVELSMQSDEGVKQMADILVVYTESSVHKQHKQNIEDEKKSQMVEKETLPQTSTPSNPSLTENSDGSHGIYTEPLSATSY